MKLMTGFNYKNSSSSPTRPFFLITNCLRPNLSSTKRLRRKDRLTSPPLQQQQPPYFPSIMMPLPSTLNVPNVATPSPRTNAQTMFERATIAVACTTTHPCAEDPRDLIAQSVMLEPNLPGTPS